MKAVTIKVVEYADPPPFPVDKMDKLLKGEVDRVGILQGGMQSGRSSLAILGNCNGQEVMLEISAINFERVAAVLRGAKQKWNESEG